MDSRFRFALPATIVVTTFLSASACKQSSSNESSDGSEGATPEYCEDIESMATCESEPACSWDAQSEVCINICYTITDQAQCDAIESCVWYEGSGTEAGETDGDGFCEAPFT